jgi:hypothetical protein
MIPLRLFDPGNGVFEWIKRELIRRGDRAEMLVSKSVKSATIHAGWYTIRCEDFGFWLFRFAFDTLLQQNPGTLLLK